MDEHTRPKAAGDSRQTLKGDGGMNGTEGMDVAYILAKINGDHWRFIGLPIVNESQAYLECDYSTGEHVVCIRFAPPAPKEARNE